MVKKIDILRGHMAADRWREALALAARFPRLGAHKEAIVRGHEAYAHPRFYQSIGRDPVTLQAAGRAALEARYGRLEAPDATGHDDTHPQA